MKILANKIAVITGATSGIGEGVAKIFAENGARLALIGRHQEIGCKIEKELSEKYKEKCFFICCDVSKEYDVIEMAKTVEKKFGKVDILFNNAGVMLPSMEIEHMPVDEWKSTFDINVNGCFLVTKYLKPLLMKSQGCIINNASIAGLQYYAVGRSYAYSASKAAIIQFSHQMAKNYGSDGIRVNCICPGIIQTPILHGRDPKIYEERIPLRRLGTPEDVAKVVLFLASDNASYLTGVVLPIDGGASL